MFGCLLQIAEDQPFLEAGLDSLGAVELRNMIASQLQVELSSTVLFDYPNTSALAAHLASTIPHDVISEPLERRSEEGLSLVRCHKVEKTIHTAERQFTLPKDSLEIR